MIGLLASLAWAVDPAPSVDVAEESELHFQRGVQAYRAGALELAIEHLLLSHRLAPNRNTAFNLARCYDELGRPDQAWRYYDVSLKGEDDPQMQAPALQAMARLEPQVARVQVRSTPPGATVYVGRRDLGVRGVAPNTLPLLPGKHTLVLELQGHSPATITQMFTANGLFEVNATLEREEADRRASALEAVWVRSDVELDGEVILSVRPQFCDVLPDRLSNVSAWREPLARMPGPVPGSSLAAQGDTDFALNVVVEDVRAQRSSRVALSRDKKQLFLDQAGLLNAWVLNRCEITNGAAVADALQELPRRRRADVVAVLAELGAGDNVAGAAFRCVRGDCEELGALLRF